MNMMRCRDWNIEMEQMYIEMEEMHIEIVQGERQLATPGVDGYKQTPRAVVQLYREARPRLMQHLHGRATGAWPTARKDRPGAELVKYRTYRHRRRIWLPAGRTRGRCLLECLLQDPHRRGHTLQWGHPRR